MMTEAYLDLPETIKQYGEARALVDEQDDLSERSTISQMPLNFNLISDFKSQEDLTADKVQFGFGIIHKWRHANLGFLWPPPSLSNAYAQSPAAVCPRKEYKVRAYKGVRDCRSSKFVIFLQPSTSNQPAPLARDKNVPFMVMLFLPPSPHGVRMKSQILAEDV